MKIQDYKKKLPSTNKVLIKYEYSTLKLNFFLKLEKRKSASNSFNDTLKLRRYNRLILIDKYFKTNYSIN
jgi:hypothetical protein